MGKQTPAERLFTLTCCLVSAQSYGVSKRQLLESVSGYAENKSQDAQDRMFERDKDLLRSMGIRLEVVDGEGSDDPEATRYRLSKQAFAWPTGFHLNPTHLQLLELAAKAWSHRSMSQEARAALTRMRAFGVADGAQSLQVVSPKLFAKDPNFGPLTDAIDQGLQVRFEYQKPGERPFSKQLSPVRLRFRAGQWILLAADAGSLKNYLLRRIVSRVVLLDAAAEPLTQDEIASAEKSLDDFILSQVAKLEVREQSEAWYHFGASETTIQVSYMDRELFIEELIEYGSDVRVIEPSELADSIQAQLRQVLQNHA
ncbi:MAG: WYL domain-containing protein [Actinobacteria bacterium]|jgi:proteasome accessory factor B|nr:WYL domain-containing protein [Actinomycetota bacterium]